MKGIVQKALKSARYSASVRGKHSVKGDDSLGKLLESIKAKIRVVGVGGGGCNTLERMTEI